MITTHNDKAFQQNLKTDRPWTVEQTMFYIEDYELNNRDAIAI